MSSCDRFRDLLVPWVDGELSDEDSRAVATHVDACPSCAGLVEALRSVNEATKGFRELEPPTDIGRRIAADPCKPWLALLFAALDGELPEDDLERLLEHMETCAGCRAVWSGLAVGTELQHLTPPARLIRRCAQVPHRREWRPLPGARTAAAAAFVLAALVSLLLGNPVSLARQGASSLTKSVHNEVREAADDGRGELRLAMWNVWQWGRSTMSSVTGVFDWTHPIQGGHDAGEQHPIERDGATTDTPAADG